MNRMNQVTLWNIWILLVALLGVPSSGAASSSFSFPDPKAFEGLKVVLVMPVAFTNMENVNLNSETLRGSMQEQLRNAAIPVVLEEFHQLATSSGEGPLQDVGLLAASVRRWETAGLMGTTMNSFAISLKFFQKARVQPAQRETWVITWFETKSILVGTKRPKGIADALNELLQKFILNFKG